MDGGVLGIASESIFSLLVPVPIVGALSRRQKAQATAGFARSFAAAQRQMAAALNRLVLAFRGDERLRCVQ